jgi:DNA-binding NtrC family response regulator
MSTAYAYPSDEDLRKLLRFSPDEGAIWLGSRRMVLLHTAAMSSLRQDLIQSIGTDHARRILNRMGFSSGKRDAEFAKKIRGDRAKFEMFAVGPQLHMLEGAAKVTPLVTEFDEASGQLYAEYRWDHSWEAYAHRQKFGLVEDPACWISLGYASGYTSAFMGRLMLFKEVQCEACGADHCKIVGKPIEEWSDGESFRHYFESDSLLEKMEVLTQQVEALKSSLESPQSSSLIGNSTAFRKAYDLLTRAAQTQVTVMLTGETGVGKERFARSLHEMSSRSAAPFVAVNCAALPSELIESELFGVEKGAFTGAHAARAGRFERADGGTLFLDEIGDLPLPAQAKLLRVLQEGEIERLGSESVRKVNVRVIAATNVDLNEAVKIGKFRRDLWYRLNVYPIAIPPLRERRADVDPLAQTMLSRFTALHNKRIPGISDQALQALHEYDWPGNVREMENLIERGVILAVQGDHIQVEDLFPNHPLATQSVIDRQGRLSAPTSAADHALCERILSSGIALETLESQILEQAVRKSNGNLSKAARLLGLTRPQLAYRLKKSASVDTPEQPPQP